MLVSKEDILNFIPQRAPFVMVDNLLVANEVDGFKTSFQVQSDNIFIENGIVSEGALVENVAQTCAAGFGYISQQQGNKEPQLGFIGAVSKLKVHGVAKPNDVLNTEVSVVSTFDRVSLIQGIVKRDGASLLECQMKIVIT